MVRRKSYSQIIWHRSTAPGTVGPYRHAPGRADEPVPAYRWQPRMLFGNAPDRTLRKLTGTFPASFHPHRSSHPIFVLEPLASLAHRVCPCSSKNFGVRRFIRRGCRLGYTNRITARDTYLVEACSFNIPLDPSFSRHLRFQGLVPSGCIEECEA